MSESKIKKLIKEYRNNYNECDYASFMVHKTKGKKKEEYEYDEEYFENKIKELALEIYNLKPSKYMLNKYPEITDIFNENYL